jgi:hypothetical protein
MVGHRLRGVNVEENRKLAGNGAVLQPPRSLEPQSGSEAGNARGAGLRLWRGIQFSRI